VEVAKGLWDSYEDDAFPRDRERRVFLDRAKQHQLNHRGRFFSVVGPLNLSRSPQGQPVIFQAGDSEQGRDLGATIGDGIFTHAASIEQALAFSREIKGRAAARGRNPDHVLIMPGISVYVGDTDDQAREIERELQLADGGFEQALAEFGRPFGWHDFRQYDLDAPFPQHTIKHAERAFFTNAKRIAGLASSQGLTLRQTVEAVSSPKRTPFAGSPQTVADELQRWFEHGAVDGYSFHLGHPAQTRRLVEDVLPILRDRDVLRRDYEGSTLRENLGLPFIENRHTAARRQSSQSYSAEERQPVPAH
jgi:FMN-dependent oxidoreductase (nitrilotriacetate monooxygenase family)